MRQGFGEKDVALGRGSGGKLELDGRNSISTRDATGHRPLC
jgi:hypothetical protein